MIQAPSSRIQTDLARVEKGDWFLPMTIKEINQHTLVDQALAMGAEGFTYQVNQASLLSESSLQAHHSSVPDLREYLFSLTREKRKALLTRTAVICGSAGKTSVKEIVGEILREWSGTNSFMSPDNQNTKIALATQILRLPESCSHAVFEMGARRVNDFAVPLSYLAPEVVALLNIGTAHIGEFGSKENLWNEKLSCLKAPTAKTVVVFGDNERILWEARATGKKVISFGFETHNDVQILNESSQEITLKIDQTLHTFICPFASSAKALNVAAAVAVAIALSIPMTVTTAALAKFKGTPRRFQMFDWDQVTAIDDAFNASPESLYEGLKTLKPLATGKKLLLVLGSMLELAQESEQAHRQVVHQVRALFGESAQKGLVQVATVGADAKWIADEWTQQGLAASAIQSFATSSEAKSLYSRRQDFDLIYFKGSKSIQLSQIFGAR
jgi:UDP-N-acetylmuramyl pentapeptide synthase